MKRIFPVALRVAAAVAVSLPVLLNPAIAQSSSKYDKDASCLYQGQVMSAVQQVRMDRVKQEDAQKTILATEPDWPEPFSKAIPQLIEHVYAMKRRDLRNVDLGAVFQEQCLANWDQIQAMKKQLQAN